MKYVTIEKRKYFFKKKTASLTCDQNLLYHSNVWFSCHGIAGFDHKMADKNCITHHQVSAFINNQGRQTQNVKQRQSQRQTKGQVICKQQWIKGNIKRSKTKK